MTREEALQAMRDGKKVTHRLFKDKEYLYMTEGAILTQDYYNVGDETCEFWKAHSDSCWQKDWLLFKEVEGAVNSIVVETIFNKKHFIIAFLNKNCFWSVKKAWGAFNEENGGFCSSIYFGKVWKEVHPDNKPSEVNSAALLEEKQSIEEGLGETLDNKQIITKEEYQSKCVLCEKTFMGEQKSLVCPECTLKAKKKVLKDFVFDNEDFFKEAFEDGYQLCLQHEQGGLKIKYDDFKEWFTTFKKQFE